MCVELQSKYWKVPGTSQVLNTVWSWERMFLTNPLKSVQVHCINESMTYHRLAKKKKTSWQKTMSACFPEETNNYQGPYFFAVFFLLWRCTWKYLHTSTPHSNHVRWASCFTMTEPVFLFIILVTGINKGYHSRLQKLSFFPNSKS